MHKQNLPVRKVCADCGSDDVGKTAAVFWDVEVQNWQISTIYDGSWCESCNSDEVRLKDQPIKPAGRVLP